MVGVLDVLHVELPVARQRLAVAAEQLHRRPHHAADAAHDLGPEIALERRRVGRQRAEHEARQRLERATCAVRDPRAGIAPACRPCRRAPCGTQRAVRLPAKIVAPVVIDADDVARLAALVEHQQRSAMRAAVLEGVERTVLVAGHHDGHRAEIGAAIAVGSRQLGLEAEETPGRPAKDRAPAPPHRCRGRNRPNRARA